MLETLTVEGKAPSSKLPAIHVNRHPYIPLTHASVWVIALVGGA
jgi:hypothetical protein